MKPHTPPRPFGVLTLLALLTLAIPGVAEACRCSSGCGMVTQGLSADVKALMEKAKSQGRAPISCIRTQACQDRLRRCYESCGQYGRAARKSAHSDGKACDFNPGHRGALRQLKNQMRLTQISDLLHRQGHGGGLHVFTNRYARTQQVAAEQKPAPVPPRRPENIEQAAEGPTARPSQREPAESVPLPRRRPSEAYEQLSNGKYQCPSGLRSICGSTRDTPWCKSWMETGHTPGCHQ